MKLGEEDEEEDMESLASAAKDYIEQKKDQIKEETPECYSN